MGVVDTNTNFAPPVLMDYGRGKSFHPEHARAPRTNPIGLSRCCSQAMAQAESVAGGTTRSMSTNEQSRVLSSPTQVSLSIYLISAGIERLCCFSSYWVPRVIPVAITGTDSWDGTYFPLGFYNGHRLYPANYWQSACFALHYHGAYCVAYHRCQGTLPELGDGVITPSFQRLITPLGTYTLRMATALLNPSVLLCQSGPSTSDIGLTRALTI